MLGVHCPTCLELLAPEDDLRCPPCGHVFHYNCLRTWFQSKRASGDPPDCPQCRKVTDTEYLMKIYLAVEADIDQQENRESAEALQCKLDVKLLEENEILRNHVQIKNEKLVKTELRSQAEINFMKKKLQKSEIETDKLRSKWLKVRKTLQELEVKQAVLKKELENHQLMEKSEKKNNLGFVEKKTNSALFPKHIDLITKCVTKMFFLVNQQWGHCTASTAVATVPFFAFFLPIYAHFCTFLPFFAQSTDFALFAAAFCYLLFSRHGHGGSDLDKKKIKSAFQTRKEKILKKKTLLSYVDSFFRNLTFEEMKNTLMQNCIGNHTDHMDTTDKIFSFFYKTIKRAAIWLLVYLLYTFCLYVSMYIKFGIFVSSHQANLFVIESSQKAMWVVFLILFLV